ncbi:SDR family NAD(P)-dependent oxidoreductase [Lysobacter silvisoli]|uniref:SDR family NAD(P)-dependent oxidoreductase n=1 Tax=Lysobacter silvisoli TaxID=2293254 RepID=A0A371K4L8_9GAMM|nr:SDR family oxidoreductase [Lysobacter silvisoli]RDZ28804.1 SDR family NAD(P)-dependent oxidoreductase [Lysobacter silvisoli]
MTQPPAPLHALITGASAGIGAALAREYARRGVPLVLTARREDRLQALAAQLRAQVPVEVIAADLADPAAPAHLHAETRRRGLAIGHLVNNAGYGVPGRYLADDWKVHADFLQVLVTAVAELSHRYLPEMEARRYGRILNVASLAGLVPPSAGHTLYGASKSFVIRFSQSLAAESRPRGVHVTALCPGFTYTEFHDVNGMRERISRLPKWLWLDADTVARLGVDAVERGDARYVTGSINRVLAGLAKYLPERVANALVASRASDFRDAE